MIKDFSNQNNEIFYVLVIDNKDIKTQDFHIDNIMLKMDLKNPVQ